MAPCFNDALVGSVSGLGLPFCPSIRSWSGSRPRCGAVSLSLIVLLGLGVPPRSTVESGSPWLSGQYGRSTGR